MMWFRCRALLAPIVVLLLLSLAAMADSASANFVIPGSAATSEGNSSGTGSGLFGVIPTTELYQIVGSELAAQGLTAGHWITGVRARVDGAGSTAPSLDTTWTDLKITLAQAANPIGGMSTTYADNMTAPLTVRSGEYTLAAGSMLGGATPNDFGVLISFTTPYVYQGGDLVIYLTHPGADGGASVMQDFAVNTFPGAVTSYRSLRNPANYGAITGNLSAALPVLQFETAAVPEAGGWMMAGVVVVGAGVARFLGRKS